MRENFDAAMRFVLAREGGYTNGSDGDPGGETKFGIAKRSHLDEDIANLTEERAKEIYLEEYWKPIADALPFPCDVIAFDTAVNQGMSFARSMVYECKTDEIAMLFYRLKKYSAIVAGRPASLKYLRGWMNRIIELHDYIREGI